MATGRLRRDRMMTVTQTTCRKTAATVPSVRPLDITVLAGGPSAERDVSLDSGKAVHAALNRLGHRAVICDIGPDDLSALDRAADFVFIALHGEFGEDGTVQAELDARGMSYSGSGTASSRAAMDKAETKRRFASAGVPTPDSVVVDATNGDEWLLRFSAPAVIKPVASGSSVDTYIAHTSDDLRKRAEAVVGIYGTALVEKFVAGPELTVGILGDEALPVCEIRTNREFYNYEAKYVDDTTEYLFDLDFPASQIERVQRLSLTAHRAVGCRVCSRVDWMIDAETQEPFALEVNTIPGFTSHSLLPKAAALIGLSFDQLCQRIIDLSLAG